MLEFQRNVGEKNFVFSLTLLYQENHEFPDNETLVNIIHN